MAESAKIGHSLAGSTKSVDGFDRPVECSKHEPSSKKAHLKENLNGQFRLGSNAKTAITALSANLCRESQYVARSWLALASMCLLIKPIPEVVVKPDEQVIGFIWCQ